MAQQTDLKVPENYQATDVDAPQRRNADSKNMFAFFVPK